MAAQDSSRRLVAPSPASIGARRGIMNIGEVLTRLEEQFPGTTASKIRFLEEKGLITPARTAAGYRKYTESDVERLRFILALQRDHYLPLKVIKDYLDAVDAGQTPPQLPGGVTLTPRSLDDGAAAELAGHRRPLSRAELEGRSGATAEFVDRLLELGIVAADEDGRFSENAAKAVTAALTLAEHGMEPRHLRTFRTAADRELGLIESAVAPLRGRKDAASSARVADAAENILAAVLQLHGAIVRSGLEDLER